MALALNLAHAFLMKLEPERAHELALLSLEQGFHPTPTPDDRRLEQTVWNMRFPNPVGVAAGFDKDGRVPQALLNSGFGFAEVGSVTPRPQEGNPKPRVFRLAEDRAVINRLGFNSAGHEAVAARLARRDGQGIVGVNVGANADSEDRVADYAAGLMAFAGLADFFVVNVSSPNTPGLRDLQAPEALERLLSRIMHARHAMLAAGRQRRAILVKLAPDIADDDLPGVVAALERNRVDGIVVSNTTVARPQLRDRAQAGEEGGLSGAPLFVPSTRMLARVFLATGGRIPLVGVGGIDSGERAVEKMRAGATLIQLYTGLVYEGPDLLYRIKDALLAAVEAEGVASVADLVGRDAHAWAGRAP